MVNLLDGNVLKGHILKKLITSNQVKRSYWITTNFCLVTSVGQVSCTSMRLRYSVYFCFALWDFA